MISGILKRTVATAFPGRLLINGGKNSEMRLALTFDDGPHPLNTPRILDIFKECESHATFFVQGLFVEKYPHLVELILAHGHQLGNHGYSHLNANEVGSHEYTEDALKGQEVLEAITGKMDCPLFRPPFGAITIPTFLKLTNSGFRYVLWSVDSRDYFVEDSEALLSVLRSQSFRSGDIVLMHEDCMLTVDAMSRILTHLKSAGFSVGTVDVVD